jgi:SAM-dependent methyltransferase
MRLSALHNLLKVAAFRTGLIKTTYPLGIEPHELFTLMAALKRGEELPGDIIEVGCGRGKTTVFLNRFLDSLGSSKRYFVVDTFSGFEQSDVSFERQVRQKREQPGFNAQSFGKFSYNSASVWHKVVVEQNKLSRVRMVVGDIKRVEFDPDQCFSTALIDVDLYLPTLAALRKVYNCLVEGGTIVVDDIVEDSLYDGAYKAFHEFVTIKDAEFSILPPTGGAIRKRSRK